MSEWWPAIERDLDWRRAELAELRRKLAAEKRPSSVGPPSLSETVLLRASWAMLYAHFEGFCMWALSYFLEQLETQGVARGTCRTSLLELSLQHHLPKIRNSTDAEFVAFVRHDFANLLQAAIEFPRVKRKGEYDLEGRSNLNPSKLAACCERCGLECDLVDSHDKRIFILVSRRNDIAHGKDTPVKSPSEYEEFEGHVLSLLDCVARAVDKALEDALYLESSK